MALLERLSHLHVGYTSIMDELRLDTPRLRLRSMRAADVDPLLAIFADPKVMASFGVDPFHREQMEQWVQRNLQHQDAHGYGLFTVIHRADGIVIGDCGLEQMNEHGEPVAELGYDFRSNYWNQGFATEAAIAVRDYAFDVLKLPQLISLIRVGNLASRRVAEKVGMHLVAEINRYNQPYWKYVVERAAIPNFTPE